jgi:hypothetical protein
MNHKFAVVQQPQHGPGDGEQVYPADIELAPVNGDLAIRRRQQLPADGDMLEAQIENIVEFASQKCEGLDERLTKLWVSVDKLLDTEQLLGQYKQLPRSLYGFFLYKLICTTDTEYSAVCSEPTYFFILSIPVLLVWLIQGTLLGYLWYSLPEISNSNDDGMCLTDPIFQIPLLVTFFVYMYNVYHDLAIEFAAFSTDDINVSKFDKNVHVNVMTVIHPRRQLVYKFVFILELSIFAELMVVGVKYILTSKGASSLIQAVLSLAFVIDIDNVAYQWVITPTNRSRFEAAFFKLTVNVDREGEGAQLKKIIVFTILLTGLVLAVIFILRTAYRC